MAETNPLFQTDAEATIRPFPSIEQQGGQPTHSQALRKMRLVAELTGQNATVTAGDPPEWLVCDLEPAFPVETALKLYYQPEATRARFLALDEMSPWFSAGYKPRRVSTSEATAFSNTEALRDRSGQDLLRHLSRYLRSIFRPPYGPALADRIETLGNTVREESEGSMTLSGESLAIFIGFLEQNPKLIRPSIVAGPSGEIVAIWKSPPHDQFTTRFLPNGTIRYLLSRANRRHPQGVSRSSGDTTGDRLFEEAGLNELRWITNR